MKKDGKEARDYKRLQKHINQSQCRDLICVSMQDTNCTKKTVMEIGTCWTSSNLRNDNFFTYENGTEILLSF